MPLLPIEDARAHALALMHENTPPDDQPITIEQRKMQEVADWIFAYCIRIKRLGGKRINYQHALWRAEKNVGRSEATAQRADEKAAAYLAFSKKPVAQSPLYPFAGIELD